MEPYQQNIYWDILVVIKPTTNGSETRKKRERLTIDIDEYGTSFSEKSTARDEKRIRSMQAGWRYLGKFGEIGFSIAIPIVIGALVGKVADVEWHSSPKGTLIGIVIGVVTSVVTFIQTIQSVLREKDL